MHALFLKSHLCSFRLSSVLNMNYQTLLPVVCIEPAVDEEVGNSVESHEDVGDIGDAEEPEGWKVEVVATDGFLHIEHLVQVDQAAREVAGQEHHNNEHKHQGESHVFCLWES